MEVSLFCYIDYSVIYEQITYEQITYAWKINVE